jgi:RNA polymerase sigma-70 factor (ECF subfamily)
MAETGRGPSSAEGFIRRLSAEHGDALLSWAVGRFRDRRDAEEVVAETLVRAWRHFDQFDPARGSERSWVFGIARNAAVDHFRRSRRHLKAVPEPAVRDEPDPDQPTERVAEASLVRDALESISEAHREVIVLAHFGGLTVAEIAARLDLPLGTAKSRLFYAMRSMRAALEERGVLQ